MAEEGRDQEDRTEEATPQRREQAREKGHLPRSRDLLAAITLFCGMAMLNVLAGPVSSGLLRVGRDAFGNLDRPRDALAVITPSVYSLGLALAPFFAATTAVALLAVILQTGVPSAEALNFDLSKLNPFARLQQMFTPSMGGWDTIKIVLKLSGVSLAAWRMLYPVWVRLGERANLEPPLLLHQALELSGDLMLRLGLLLLLIALLDYVIARLRVSRELRMSKHDVKEELRHNEGNPQVKRALRRKAREIMRRRLVVEVPKADVVVVNPTHYAVALSYKAQKMKAPRVTAKGVDQMALKIRELARGASVPVISSPKLARDLHRRVAVGKEVPSDLYRVVAEVLAFVYRIKRRMPSGHDGMTRKA